MPVGACYLRGGLYSLVGVKYMLSPDTLGWPGFSQIGSVGNIRVFRNDLALPLGVVHYRQIPEEEFRRATPISRDFIMFNGIVTEKPISGLPALSLETLLSSGTDNLNTLYAEPATVLRQGGLVKMVLSLTSPQPHNVNKIEDYGLKTVTHAGEGNSSG